MPARSAIHSVSSGPAAPADGPWALATSVRDALTGLTGSAGSTADAVARVRDVTRQSVPMIAELLVRNFTVASWRRRMGEVTRLLERS